MRYSFVKLNTGGNSFLICVLNGEKAVSHIMKEQFH